MEKKYTVGTLNDLSGLREIYNLRCRAWESSKLCNSINFRNYPQGYEEPLDKKSVHFVARNRTDQIIAAARLTLLQDFNQLPYPDFFRIIKEQRKEGPFLFYSRLVIDPRYRRRGIKEKMDLIRVNYQLENQIAFSIATATSKRVADLKEYGFKKLATGTRSEYPEFPFQYGEILVLNLTDIVMPSLATLNEIKGLEISPILSDTF